MWWHSLGEADLPLEQGWLSAAETQRMSTMKFTKRRSEWLLARWTAKQAVAGILGLRADPAGLTRIEIRTVTSGAAQGAPEVFVEGSRVRGGISMTDRAGWAVCMFGEVDEIGCDLELVEARSDSFVQDFFTPSERKVIVDPPLDATPDVLANLIWSTKESALKVLRTGLRRDTRSVEVVLSPDVPVDGWRPLVIHIEGGIPFPGWWRQYGVFLLTAVAASDFAPPRPLLEPPGLASAEPSHSWMAAPIVTEEPRSRE